MSPDAQTIERITYLASLVSNASDVDPMMDTLREVTAHQTPNQPIQLSNEEKALLQQLDSQLIDYLTTKDPVRAFTPESLQAKLAHHFKQTDPRQQANRGALRQTFVIIGLALVGYGLGVALIPGEPSARFALAAPIFMLVIGIGIAWTYWKARSILVPTMQTSFAFMAMAVTLSAFVSAQYPVLSAYPELGDRPLFHYGGFIVPYVVMYALLYAGFYQFARQLRQSALIAIFRPQWMAVAALCLVGVGFLMPHPTTDFTLFYKISAASIFLNILFCSAGALLGLSAARQITRRYTNALRSMALATGAYAVVNCALGGLLLTTGKLNPADPRVAGISSLYSVALILLLASAYLLKRNVQE